MSATKQTQTVDIANQIIALAAQIRSVYDQANSLASKYTNQATVATLTGLPTAALNADGTLGAADGSPVAANPIDTRIVTGLNRAISKTKLVAAKGVLDDLVLFMNNGAVTTKDRNAINDDLIGG